MKKRPTSKARKPSASQRSKERGENNLQRLNKILAGAGLGSRRQVEELITQGRVEIDREVVTDLACKVDPNQVSIKVDGSAIKRFRPVYFALNKPSGVLSTNKDPSGRLRVIDFVPDSDRVFCVGRLDRSSEGLILLTNDGDLAQQLAHPKFGVQKTYFVVVQGTLEEADLQKLRKGVYLAEGIARVDGATIRKHRKGCTEIEIVLSEGKNREIRRILARAGHKVVVLRRLAIGPLRLGQLPVGASRQLTASEVNALYVAAETARNPKSRSTRPAGNQPTRKTRKISEKENSLSEDTLDSSLNDNIDLKQWDTQEPLLLGKPVNLDDESDAIDVDVPARLKHQGGIGAVLGSDDDDEFFSDLGDEFLLVNEDDDEDSEPLVPTQQRAYGGKRFGDKRKTQLRQADPKKTSAKGSRGKSKVRNQARASGNPRTKGTKRATSKGPVDGLRSSRTNKSNSRSLPKKAAAKKRRG